MSATAVIPARYASTRFPGKALADRTGKPLIQHVVEQVRKAQLIDRVIVATDDQRIYDAAVGFGCEAMLTRPDHPNGTSRIAEVVANLSASTPQASSPKPQASDIIVNVQGDEPEIDPRVIDQLVHGLEADGDAPMATLASDFADDEDPADPNIVKLVTYRVEGRCRALYFSRSLIPHHRDHPQSAIRNPQYLKHPGLYAYRRRFLVKYVTLAPSPLELAEQLEQLRALEHGYPIAVVKTEVRHHGIDTPQQYEQFVHRYRNQHS
ncbi:MAG: 3-deoxy-manno-octulosonate cytidylyltransferase [Phycisphaeraceae bacterium]